MKIGSDRGKDNRGQNDESTKYHDGNRPDPLEWPNIEEMKSIGRKLDGRIARAEYIGQGNATNETAEMPPVIDSWHESDREVDQCDHDDLAQLEASKITECVAVQI